MQALYPHPQNGAGLGIQAKDYEKSKYYDLTATFPVIIFYGWSAWCAVPSLRANYEFLRREETDPAVLAATIAQFSGILFWALLIVLLLIRSVPVAKTQMLLPRAAAVAGAFAALLYLQLPRVDISLTQSVVSSILIFLGLFSTAFALVWLGLSFSIMPEARRLVTTGLYAWVRHPIISLRKSRLWESPCSSLCRGRFCL